jgi:hypothetical protein
LDLDSQNIVLAMKVKFQGEEKPLDKVFPLELLEEAFLNNIFTFSFSKSMQTKKSTVFVNHSPVRTT